MLSRPLLKLYRDILAAHRRLPTAHRDLGDAYVKAEFRQHRAPSTGTSHLQQFERQWRDYLTTLRVSFGGGSGAEPVQPLGRALTGEEIQALSEDQRAKLLESLSKQ
jgi:hypothetical protein|tara:strand:+ start:158 stop:478 length:321 start_codon:yes stop_codon:yes gene_type:complete